MKLKSALLVLALLASPIAMAKTPQTSSQRIGTSEALSVRDARLGEVLMVRQVRLQNDARMNAGTAIGSAVGLGVASKSKGSQKRAKQVAGTLIGGLAGTKAQQALSNQRGVEIFVRDLEDRRSRIIAIVQADDQDIQVGDQVFLVGKGTKTRVVVIPQVTSR